jgi:hypothetical protein
MAQSVYKFYGDPDRLWEGIQHYFNGFKAFYEEVALHEEAVLTIIT